MPLNKKQVDQTICYVDNLESMAIEFLERLAETDQTIFGTEGLKLMRNHIKLVASSARTNINDNINDIDAGD